MKNYANYPEPIVVINQDKACELVVIWLHGLGADGKDFLGLIDNLPLAQKIDIRFIFPNAPVIPVTVNAGMRMRAWYDVHALDFNSRQDLDGVKNSAQMINVIIKHEMERNLSAKQIILGGFSQGGAISLYLGARLPFALGGIVALSTYLIDPEQFAVERADNSLDTPIFMAHGIFDAVVPLYLAQAGLQILKQEKYQVDWHTYPLPHSVDYNEIQHINDFLEKVYTRIK